VDIRDTKAQLERLSRKVNAEGLKIEETIAEQLEGAGVTEAHVKTALSRLKLPRDKPHVWTDEQIIELSDMLRAQSKPLITAANKIDIAPQENIDKLKKTGAIPVSAAAEAALRLADKSGAISIYQGMTILRNLQACPRRRKRRSPTSRPHEDKWGHRDTEMHQ